MIKRFCLILLLLCPALPTFAVNPDEILSDPQLEARAREISTHLRCLVCQNQSIDDSNAPLARDLRILVRERLIAGDSDAAVRSFLVARYGEFVLLEPAITGRTVLLWITPLMALLIGSAILFVGLRRRATAVAPLDPAEARKLASLAPGSAPPKKEN